MKTVTIDSYKKAYKLGAKHATTGDWISFYTPVLQIAYEVGMSGKQIDWTVVTCLRAGSVPDMGLSNNFRDDCSERGLSVLNVVGEKEIGSSVWFSGRKVIEVDGIRLPYKGSDGETLILPLCVEDFDF